MKDVYFNHKNQQNLSRGFTLIEMAIYMGLLLVLIAVLTSLFGSTLDTQLESDATSGVQQDGEYLLAKLTSDVRQASSITTPALGQQGSTLQVVIAGTPTTYSTNSSGQLTVTANGSTDILSSATASISGVLFTVTGNSGGKDDIQVSFTLTGTTKEKSGAQSQAFSSIIGLR